MVGARLQLEELGELEAVLEARRQTAEASSSEGEFTTSEEEAGDMPLEEVVAGATGTETEQASASSTTNEALAAQHADGGKLAGYLQAPEGGGLPSVIQEGVFVCSAACFSPVA